MDLLFALTWSFTLVVGLICMILTLGNDHNPTPKARLITFIISLIALFVCGLITYSICEYSPTPTVLVRQIEEIRNVPYYFDENDRPVELTGDQKFADPKTTEVHINMYPSGWNNLVYVEGFKKVELVKKKKEVEQKVQTDE